MRSPVYTQLTVTTCVSSYATALHSCASLRHASVIISCCCCVVWCGIAYIALTHHVHREKCEREWQRGRPGRAVAMVYGWSPLRREWLVCRGPCQCFRVLRMPCPVHGVSGHLCKGWQSKQPMCGSLVVPGELPCLVPVPDAGGTEHSAYCAASSACQPQAPRVLPSSQVTPPTADVLKYKRVFTDRTPYLYLGTLS